MIRRCGAVLAICLMSAACQTLPYAGSGLPKIVAVEDVSDQRRAMNANIYDRSVRTVLDRFYDPTFNNVDFAAEAAARRSAAVDQPTEQEFYLSLNELLGLLEDRHTVAIRPRPYPEIIRSLGSGELSFGMDLTTEKDEDGNWSNPFVRRLRPDGPAAQLGVQPGWEILSIDGSDTFDIGIEVGRSHTFEFRDPKGEVHVVTMATTLFPIEKGYVERRADGTVVIAFESFDRTTTDWLDERLAELRSDPPAAVVIDIRYNRGGDADAIPEVLGGFFTERFQFGHDQFRLRDRLEMTFWGTLPPKHTKPSINVWTGPVVVLQSSRSASSAEIFAATMKHCGRAVIVGETSRGAVVSAQAFRLPDGGLLRVGIADFRTATGARLEKVGVEPDIHVAGGLQDLRTGGQVLLDAAAQAALAAPAGAVCRPPAA
ncbi:MAG: S41 family peptidase [Brevundimonas sp.]